MKIASDKIDECFCYCVSSIEAMKIEKRFTLPINPLQPKQGIDFPLILLQYFQINNVGKTHFSARAMTAVSCRNCVVNSIQMIFFPQKTFDLKKENKND